MISALVGFVVGIFFAALFPAPSQLIRDKVTAGWKAFAALFSKDSSS